MPRPAMVPYPPLRRRNVSPDYTGVMAALKLRAEARASSARSTGGPGLIRNVTVPLAVVPDRPRAPGEVYYSVPHAASVLLRQPHLNSVARHRCRRDQRGYIDAGTVPFVPEMTEMVRQLMRDKDVLFQGVHVSLAQEIRSSGLPKVDFLVAPRTPRVNRHAREFAARVRRFLVATCDSRAYASLGADVVAAALLTDPRSSSLGQHLPHSGLAIAPPDFLRRAARYSSRHVVNAGEILGNALDRVIVAREIAITSVPILLRCGLDAGVLREHCESWQHNNEEDREAIDQRMREERAVVDTATTMAAEQNRR